MSESLPGWVPDHIKVASGGPELYDIECSVCGISMKHRVAHPDSIAPDLAAVFLVQHAVHRGKEAAGLTPSGDLSAAFRRYMEGWRRGAQR